MTLAATNHKDLQLFYTVQAKLRDETYNFTFIPKFEEVAIVTIDSLLPILIENVGEYMANLVYIYSPRGSTDCEMESNGR